MAAPSGSPELSSRGREPLLDGVATFWVVLWLVLGAWTGYEIWQLTGLSRATVESGRSLQSVASAIEALDDVPVVGDTTAPIADQIAQTADDITESGYRTERSLRGLAILIGLAIGVGPSGPVILIYLPRRWSARRASRGTSPPSPPDE